jgi:hypothetical protein
MQVNFKSFVPHFQIKLNTHGSNLNSIFVIMNELKFILLVGILILNFNTMDLVKFLKIIKTSHLDRRVTLKVTSCKTMNKQKSKKNVKHPF